MDQSSDHGRSACPVYVGQGTYCCCGEVKQTTRTVVYSTEPPGCFNVEPADVCHDCRPQHEKALAMTLEFRRFGEDDDA